MVVSTIIAIYLLQQEILNEDNFVCQSFQEVRKVKIRDIFIRNIKNETN